MTLSTTANVSLTIQATQTNSNTLATYTGAPRVAHKSRLSTTDVSKVYFASRTLTGTETLDVTSGLSDPFGNALVFAHVRGFIVVNTGAGNLTVGGGTNAAFGSDQFTVNAGKCVATDSAYAADVTHKNVRVVAAAPTTYSILIVGD